MQNENHKFPDNKRVPKYFHTSAKIQRQTKNFPADKKADRGTEEDRAKTPTQKRTDYAWQNEVRLLQFYRQAESMQKEDYIKKDALSLTGVRVFC